MNRFGIAALLLLAMAATVSPQARNRGPHIAGTKFDLKEAVSYETPKPDGARSCTCNELARRIHGLQMMVAASELPTFAQSYPACHLKFIHKSIPEQLFIYCAIIYLTGDLSILKCGLSFNSRPFSGGLYSSCADV